MYFSRETSEFQGRGQSTAKFYKVMVQEGIATFNTVCHTYTVPLGREEVIGQKDLNFNKLSPVEQRPLVNLPSQGFFKLENGIVGADLFSESITKVTFAPGGVFPADEVRVVAEMGVRKPLFKEVGKVSPGFRIRSAAGTGTASG